VRPSLLFFAAVVLAGINMRMVFASLPPLLQEVRDDLGLSAAAAGLLTTAPVLCFGALAPLAPPLVRRVPIERVVAASAALTALGAGLRGVGGAGGLFAGTLLAGAAVAVAQTSVPVLVRARFRGASGALTGAFSMALTLGAAVAAAAAVPLERLLGGWRAALAAYALPAALAAMLWLGAGARTRVDRARPVGLRRLSRAWSLPAYFGLQAMSFYCGLAWLPTILEEEGYGEAAAGSLLALTNAVQFAPALLVPVLAARRSDQRPILCALVALAATGVAGVLLAPGAAVFWMLVLGLGQGGSLGLSLYLPVLRGADAVEVAALTALTLSAGYLLTAVGPTLMGLAHDLSDGWTVPLLLMIAITLAELAPGWIAARPWTASPRAVTSTRRARRSTVRGR
jgi:CP family cyanate transporter-like MFS transporter